MENDSDFAVASGEAWTISNIHPTRSDEVSLGSRANEQIYSKYHISTDIEQ